MYRVQVVLLERAGRRSLGMFELPVFPRMGESLVVTLTSEHKLVQIQEIIYTAYPLAKRPESAMDAILVVSPKPATE